MMINFVVKNLMYRYNSLHGLTLSNHKHAWTLSNHKYVLLKNLPISNLK